MIIREIRENELSELLELYTHLHERGVPENSGHLQKTWKTICGDENHHIIVCEADGKLVSSCGVRDHSQPDAQRPSVCVYRKCCYPFRLQRKGLRDRLSEPREGTGGQGGLL